MSRTGGRFVRLPVLFLSVVIVACSTFGTAADSKPAADAGAASSSGDSATSSSGSSGVTINDAGPFVLLDAGAFPASCIEERPMDDDLETLAGWTLTPGSCRMEHDSTAGARFILVGSGPQSCPLTRPRLGATSCPVTVSAGFAFAGMTGNDAILLEVVFENGGRLGLAMFADHRLRVIERASAMATPKVLGTTLEKGHLLGTDPPQEINLAYTPPSSVTAHISGHDDEKISATSTIPFDRTVAVVIGVGASNGPGSFSFDRIAVNGQNK